MRARVIRRVSLLVAAVILVVGGGIYIASNLGGCDLPDATAMNGNVKGIGIPKNFTATRDGSHTITLSWDKVKGADGYVIYRYDEETKKYEAYKQIKNGDETSYKNRWLSKDSVYKYLISAYQETDGDDFAYGGVSYGVSCETYSGDSKTANAGKVSFGQDEVKLNVTESTVVSASVGSEEKGKALFDDSQVMYSSDESVASVDADGRVLARGVGSCEIVCRAHNGKAGNVKVNVEMGTVASAIPIITYHRIYSDEQKSAEKPGKYTDLNVSKSDFAAQMKWLYDEGYKTISCEEFEQWHGGKIELPKKTVMITFDDGYQNVYDNAEGILDQYGFKATEFIIGKFSEGDGSGDSMSQNTTMKNSRAQYPGFDFQSHTYDMHTQVNKFGVFDTLTAEQLKADFEKQKELYGFEYIAYPYGQYNEKLTSMAEKTGIKMGFTYKGNKVVYATRNSGRYEIPRFMVNGDYSLNQFIGYFK